MADYQTGFHQLIGLGGPIVWLLILLSVISLTVILVKLWQFGRARLNVGTTLSQALEFWSRGEADSAFNCAQKDNRPLATLLLFAMRGMVESGDRLDLVREELTRLGSDQMEKLRSHLRILEVIATVSPLLGLLGTVLGMIEAFQQLEMAGNRVDPAVLSGGIWQALLTTAVGLGVAIPTLLAHNWLERKVEGYGHRVNDVITRVFTQPVAAALETGR